jgi:pimeloyl-ACP methyl ester carboxylesterase
MLTKITTHGSGEKTFVLLPGWNHSFENEQLFIELLAHKHTVLTVSPPGYSGTPESKILLDFSELAQDIKQQLTEKNCLDATFVGFSMGSRIVAELAQIMPVANPIFIGCPLELTDVPRWARLLIKNNGIVGLLRTSPHFQRFAVTKALRSAAQDVTAVFSERAATLSGAFDSLIGLLNSTASLKCYLKTATFIYGEHDPYLPLAQEVGITKLRIVKDAGHACIWGHEEEVVNLMLQTSSRT